MFFYRKSWHKILKKQGVERFFCADYIKKWWFFSDFARFKYIDKHFL